MEGAGVKAMSEGVRAMGPHLAVADGAAADGAPSPLIGHAGIVS